MTAQMDADEELHSELKRLSEAFGIGIIVLNTAEPDASEVLFPALTRDRLDWSTINKIAAENPDFAEFLRRIRIDLASKEVRRDAYDLVDSTGRMIEKYKL